MLDPLNLSPATDVIESDEKIISLVAKNTAPDAI